MDTQSSIGGLLPLWLIVAPLVLAIFDLTRTPRAAHSTDARPASGGANAGVGIGGARLAPR